LKAPAQRTFTQVLNPERPKTAQAWATASTSAMTATNLAEALGNPSSPEAYGPLVVHAELPGLMSKTCLSTCAVHYAASLADPFHVNGACIPASPCFPSQKLTSWVKGEFNCTATAGVAPFGSGWVLFNPLAAIANDLNCISVSASGIASSATIVATANLTKATNGPYVAADYGVTADLLKYRLVSAGLRIKYIGNEYNRGGMLVGYSDPFHSSQNGESIVDLRAHRGVTTHTPSDDRWYGVTWRPAQPTDLSFVGFTPLQVNDAGAESGMAFMIYPAVASGAAASNPSFEYEAYVNYEVIGKKAGPQSTRMPADPIGAQGVFDWATSQINSMSGGGSVNDIADALEGVTAAMAAYSIAGLPGLTGAVAQRLARRLPFRQNE
jgi:hypothetical protein